MNFGSVCKEKLSAFKTHNRPPYGLIFTGTSTLLKYLALHKIIACTSPEVQAPLDNICRYKKHVALWQEDSYNASLLASLAL